MEEIDINLSSLLSALCRAIASFYAEGGFKVKFANEVGEPSLTCRHFEICQFKRGAYWRRVLIGEECLLETGSYWRGELIGDGCLLETGAYLRGVLIGDGCLLERSAYWRRVLIGDGCLLETGAYWRRVLIGEEAFWGGGLLERGPNRAFTLFFCFNSEIYGNLFSR